MLLIGLTGGIATGKSTVAEMLAQKGAVIIDADQIARDIVAPGSMLLEKIQSLFPQPIRLTDGSLDRAAVRRQIFEDPVLRARYEALLHPAIAEQAQLQLDAARQQNVVLAVYMAPLLFETGAHQRVGTQENWVVSTSLEVQRERLLRRDRCSQEQAEQIMAAQMPLAEKIRRADLVIDNSGSLDETRQQVLDAWDERIAPYVR